MPEWSKQHTCLTNSVEWRMQKVGTLRFVDDPKEHSPNEKPRHHVKQISRITTNFKTYQQMSQAAACDGTTVTTTAEEQEIAPGMLPTF